MTRWKWLLFMVALVVWTSVLHLTIGDGWEGVVVALLGIAISFLLGHLYGAVAGREAKP